jgi:hypothetical protein
MKSGAFVVLIVALVVVNANERKFLLQIYQCNGFNFLGDGVMESCVVRKCTEIFAGSNYGK